METIISDKELALFLSTTGIRLLDSTYDIYRQDDGYAIREFNERAAIIAWEFGGSTIEETIKRFRELISERTLSHLAKGFSK